MLANCVAGQFAGGLITFNFVVMSAKSFMTYELEQEIRETLQSIGLNSRDADIYIVLCNLGPQPGSVIAKSLAMKRTTVYHCLQRLVDKGFVFPHKESSATYFHLNPVTDAISKIELEKERLNQQQLNLQKISFVLQQRMVEDEISKMKYREFKGTSELKRLKMSTLKKTKEVCIFASPGPSGLIVAQKDRAFWKRFESRIKKDGIEVRIIVPNTIGGQALKEDSVNRPYTVKTVPRDTFPVSEEIEVSIVEDRLVVIGGLFGAEIIGKELTQVKKSAFNLAWRGADLLEAGCSLAVTENDIPLVLQVTREE